MKILGIGSRVEVRGVSARVEAITSKEIVLKSYDPRYGGKGGTAANETEWVTFQKVNKMINEKILVIS
jgi:hypothetical protein